MYFTDEELKCRSTGIVKLADGFIDELIALRTAYGKPMIITSCCRSREYNAKVGGRPNSFHIYDHQDRNFGTCAADIKITDSHEVAEFVKLALNMGWSVGVNKAFVHIDMRTKYTDFRRVLFLY